LILLRNRLPNSNLLQISVNGMYVAEAYLTLSFLYQYQCKSSPWLLSSVSSVIRFVFRVDLVHYGRCSLLPCTSHTCRSTSKHRV